MISRVFCGQVKRSHMKSVKIALTSQGSSPLTGNIRPRRSVCRSLPISSGNASPIHRKLYLPYHPTFTYIRNWIPQRVDYLHRIQYRNRQCHQLRHKAISQKLSLLVHFERHHSNNPLSLWQVELRLQAPYQGNLLQRIGQCQQKLDEHGIRPTHRGWQILYLII